MTPRFGQSIVAMWPKCVDRLVVAIFPAPTLAYHKTMDRSLGKDSVALFYPCLLEY